MRVLVQELFTESLCGIELARKAQLLGFFEPIEGFSQDIRAAGRS
jgi:hypothetical protein